MMLFIITIPISFGQIEQTVEENSTKVDDKKDSEIEEEHTWVYAFFISCLILAIIFVIIQRIVHSGDDKADLMTVLSDVKLIPSLSLFQFFLWTLVVGFGFLFVYFVRLLGGAYDYPSEFFPYSLLALMGISSVVPTIRYKIRTDEAKEISEKLTEKQKNVVAEQEKNISEKSSVRGNFKSILQENGKVTLTRVQMFVWTWISIIIYLSILFSTTIDADYTGVIETIGKVDCKNLSEKNDLRCLGLPDIDTSLVVLMGLSQGAYLGSEFYSSKKNIDEISKRTQE